MSPISAAGWWASTVCHDCRLLAIGYAPGLTFRIDNVRLASLVVLIVIPVGVLIAGALTRRPIFARAHQFAE